jgi:hypothetical protein
LGLKMPYFITLLLEFIPIVSSTSFFQFWFDEQKYG